MLSEVLSGFKKKARRRGFYTVQRQYASTNIIMLQWDPDGHTHEQKKYYAQSGDKLVAG